MKQLRPIIVVDLFPEVLDELLGLLAQLSPEEWDRPTSCALWSVKDVALHLLGGEVGILSRQRDRFRPAAGPINNWDELVALIDGLNQTWVTATRRISPRLLCDLLRLTGGQVCEHFQSLDPDALGEPVSWAGPESAPVWLDLAREYTERWHHQQQIRDAVGRPGLKQPRYFAPALDAFVRAWPHAYREVAAEDGTSLALTIEGEAGGAWRLLRDQGRWRLSPDDGAPPRAHVFLPQEVAWRLFTKGVDREAARGQARVVGDQSLAAHIFEMVSVIG